MDIRRSRSIGLSLAAAVLAACTAATAAPSASASTSPACGTSSQTIRVRNYATADATAARLSWYQAGHTSNYHTMGEQAADGQAYLYCLPVNYGGIIIDANTPSGAWEAARYLKPRAGAILSLSLVDNPFGANYNSGDNHWQFL